jgi:hypothetical protein
MKKQLLTVVLFLSGLLLFAQSPRIALYEEFTGETCPPCASTNPGLNAKLLSALNATRVIAIKWQVPIPSAPANSWSLYQTNKAEIDWRYRSTAAGGYGYPSQNTSSSPITSGVNSAPSGRFDGQHQWVFGATSDHPTYVSDAVILAAKNVPAPFTINMTRAWGGTNSSAVDLTVTITASQNFTSVGALKFRCVMVERLIQFSVQPGTNGEKTFEDVAIKSFPDIQNGTPLQSSWTNGASTTFTLSCPIPAYARKKSEIAMVGFIQDDGDRKIHQAARADKAPLVYDALASGVTIDPSCAGSIAPELVVSNIGANAITSMTIQPYIDGSAVNVQTWSGNILPGASGNVVLSSINVSNVNGSHTFSYNITGVNAGDGDLTNNSGKVNFLVASSFNGNPVVESFANTAFPNPGFVVVNADGGPAWTRDGANGAYQINPQHSAKYDFFGNKKIGDIDEFILPPVDLSGGAAPTISFDYAYAQRLSTSNDKLEIMASKDCGANWTTVYTNSGASMATAASPIANAWQPVFSEWISPNAIPLPGFNAPQVIVKFVTTNDNGNILYLDNINLSQSVPSSVAKNGVIAFTGVNVYPNPSNGLSTVEISTPTSGQARVIMYNTLGQVMTGMNTNVRAGSNYMPVDLREYPNGVYVMQVSIDDQVFSKRITLQK